MYFPRPCQLLEIDRFASMSLNFDFFPIRPSKLTMLQIANCVGRELSFFCTGILPAVFQTVIGAQAGLIILLYKDHKTRVLHWVGWGLLTGVLGLLLALPGGGEGLIPINKNLW
jgi:hypothetical protein